MCHCRRRCRRHRRMCSARSPARSPADGSRSLALEGPRMTRGTDSDALIDMYMTCSQPHTRPLSGRRQSRLHLKCTKRGKCSAFTGLLRGQQSSPRLSFSALRVGGCRRRFVTQRGTWSRRSVAWWSVSFGPRQERKTCSRGGQRALRSHIPKLLQRCLQPRLKYQI